MNHAHDDERVVHKVVNKRLRSVDLLEDAAKKFKNFFGAKMFLHAEIRFDFMFACC